MAKILVLGAAGMLGHKVCQEHLRLGHTVFGFVRRPDSRLSRAAPGLKITHGIDALSGDTLESEIRNLSPDFIVNAVGIVKQLGEASNKFQCTAINAWLPHRLARICSTTGSKLIHISTDCVFDGTRGNYSESDASTATDLYGKSKWLGEPDATDTFVVTLRTSIIGRELKRPTHGLVEWFLAQEGTSVKGFSKAVFSGLTTIELSRVIAGIVNTYRSLHGLYHVASSPINKFELLTLIKEHAKLSTMIEQDEDFKCDRSLEMKLFTRATGYQSPSWPEMVKEMLSDTTPYYQLQREQQS